MSPKKDQIPYFFGLPESTDGNFRVLGIPWDESSSYRKGSKEAPYKIRTATDAYLYESITEDLTELGKYLSYEDLGDLEVDDLEFEELIEMINSVIEEDYRQEAIYLFLGGDHSITYPIVKALKGQVEDDFGIIDFDAHPDLYDSLNGNEYSHGCPFRRIIDEGLVEPENIVQIGLRASTIEHVKYAEEKGINIIGADELDKIRELNLGFDKAYISFDMDVLDPAFAPGVGNPEPGGISTRELIDIVKDLDVQVEAFDIVEFNPERDSSDITAYAAAKIIKEVLGINF